MAKEKCAGIIAYYYDLTTNQFKFLVAHPGGPFFKNVQKYGSVLSLTASLFRRLA